MDYTGTTKQDIKDAKEKKKQEEKRKKETFKEAKKAYKNNYSKWERFKMKVQVKTPKWKKIEKYYNQDQMNAVLQEAQNHELESGGIHI